MLVENYKRWGAVDYLAFNYFNRTLWARIEKWGSDDFLAEVDHYREQTERVVRFCRRWLKRKVEGVITVDASLWDQGFDITTENCTLIMDPLKNIIKSQYDELNVPVEEIATRDVPGC